MTERTHEDEVVRHEVALDADREAVWALLSDPTELAAWLADAAWLDAIEPGARGLLATDGELREVVVEEVEPERRVALRWAALPDGPERLVELTLDDRPEGGTRLVVVELEVAAIRAVGPAFAAVLGGGAGPQGGAPAGPRMLALA